MLRVRVDKLTFSDGTQLDLPESGVTIFVGPNNAGKSQALKDLIGLPRDSSYKGKTITNAQYIKSEEGNAEEWFSKNLLPLRKDGQTQYRVEGWGDVPVDYVVTQWNQPNLHVLTSIFVMRADGTSRLTAGNSQPSIDFSVEAASHPIQVAYQDSALEQEVNFESQAAFGLEAMIDRYGGSVIPLRLGVRPIFEHNEGVPSQVYLDALKSMPTLEEQGDGVRSYLGLVLYLAAGRQQVVLIDEPEAFLHPPQAQRLGGVLARKATNQQVIIATHSTSILQGVLEKKVPTTIVRVSREGDINYASVLSSEAVEELWSDSLLRYSNVLDGLFHDAVVICESDADCRYYSAVLDHLPPLTTEQVPGRGPQLLFTHCGGKARMSSVVRALRAVDVPVVVVADFDVLRNSVDVENIANSMGADFGSFRHDLQIVARQLESDNKPLRKLALRDDFNTKIDALPNETIDRREAELLRAAIRTESGWDKAKRSGISAISQGDAYEACRRLLDGLKLARLLVVPVGELERFVPGVPGHGPGWVTTVLGRDLHRTPSHEAIEFVTSIREAATRRIGDV